MAGEELLIADSVDQDREGLRQLFDSRGYVCTACADDATARDLLRRKFFPAAVIDLDFAGPSGGLELARFIQHASPPTRIVVLTGRRSFEAAVDALRLGATDVVVKRPDQVGYLESAVSRALDLSLSGNKDSQLLREVKDTLEDSFKIMLQMARRIHGTGSQSSSSLNMKPAILLIDEDQSFLQQVADLIADKPWDISVELSGGSGLDKASTFSFQIVAVREQLMDLPGQMVLKSSQAQQTQSLGLVYSAAGTVDRYEGGQATQSWPFSGPQDLVRALGLLVDEIRARSEERRYMQAFRSEHGNFLKRFAELKVRINSLSD